MLPLPAATTKPPKVCVLSCQFTYLRYHVLRITQRRIGRQVVVHFLVRKSCGLAVFCLRGHCIDTRLAVLPFLAAVNPVLGFGCCYKCLIENFLKRRNAHNDSPFLCA